MLRKATAVAIMLGSMVLGGTGLTHTALAATHTGARSASHALATKVYKDAAGIAFQYPSNWMIQKNAKSADVFGKYGAQMAPTASLLAAPDQGSILGILVHNGTTSDATIKSLSKGFLSEGVKALGPLTVAVKSINGVKYQVSELVAKTSDSGTQVDELVVATSHGTHTFYIVAGIMMSKGGKQITQALYNSRIKDVDNIINSTILK